MNWDNIYDKLVNYIKFASKQTSIQYSARANNSAEDLFQEGQLLLYTCWLKYKDKTEEEFCRIFKASLWRELRSICNKNQVTQVDLDEVFDLGEELDFHDKLEAESNLKDVIELLTGNNLALAILKEFINPSLRTLWEAEMDVNRKNCLHAQELVKYQGREVIVRKKHIQRALEVSVSDFNSAYREVKEAVSLIYKVDEDFKDDYMSIVG